MALPVIVMVRRKSKTVESFFFIIVLYKSYRITTPGSQINQLVHELYELMEEEIKIVERMLRETKETPTLPTLKGMLRDSPGKGRRKRDIDEDATWNYYFIISYNL
jgi:hypothetical protein